MNKRTDLQATEESQIVQVLLREGIELAGSAVALGKILGVSRISLWSWEHNEYLPRGRNLLLLMNYVALEKAKTKPKRKSAAKATENESEELAKSA